MALKFDLNCVYNSFGNTGNNDLKQLLSFVQQDPFINTISDASYALATFAIESAYRGNVYESYFLNKAPYDSPKNASPKYINWASGKSNYKGPRYPNGVPMYVGRGLIQITHDYNYKTYSSVVPGLLENPELAMNVNNAWLIAMKYFQSRKTLQKAASGDLTAARKSVNGGTNGISEVNAVYQKWLNTFRKCGCQENQSGSPIASSNVIRGGPGSNSSSTVDVSSSNSTEASTTYSQGYINGSGSNPGTPYAAFFSQLNQTIGVSSDPAGENSGGTVTEPISTATVATNSINSPIQQSSQSVAETTTKPVSTIKENNSNSCG